MRHLLFIILLFLFFSCTNDDYFSRETPLVVEGWIEDDGFPVVILTRALGINGVGEEIDSLNNCLVRWAKVSISDGSDTVVLTGKYDAAYYPPYIYTTTRMRGKVGKTYHLLIEDDNIRATATTTIPEPPVIDTFKISRCKDIDTLYQILAYMKRPTNERCFYQFFTCTDTLSRQYIASFMGSIDSSQGEGRMEIPVFRGHTSWKESYTPYFQLDDYVAVKCCRVDEFGYSFWKEQIQSTYLGGAAIVESIANPPTNITGGIGYWCGYGSVTRYFHIQETLRDK